ncbi:MAG: heme exporter protein CcmD [Rhodobacterales bacterium]|nr:heme exporter protein CcmD [Rhodobacterales bacterium]NCX59050.1 heme exporter protein CcmD [Paracoccaceae bacterium]NDA29428.1 heme exporter protein CcmD [Alphaproteobacteria bacterium]
MPDLGNYAFHVLSSYGVTTLVIVVVIIFSYIKYKRAKNFLEKIEANINGK